MKIVCIGGGPAGLYFALLYKKARPEADITVLERNPDGVTFGWGVVFSDETLSYLEENDVPTHEAITKSFAHWTAIDIFYKGVCLRSDGHGFSGIARKELLAILQNRCRELGVKIQFGVEVDDYTEHTRGADLVIACDGVKSKIRERHAATFKPSIELRHARYIWLGTKKKFDAFTFYFEENEHGMFQVHAYRFDDDTSTFIVECDEESFQKAGLGKMSTEESIAYCEELFAKHLQGEKLLPNRSMWVQFPTIKNECWSHENVVLMGDAAHTAHFSIGSGTKLAMEDSIALCKALLATSNVASALQLYETDRRPIVERTQKAAQDSLLWFEHVKRYRDLDPEQFAFSLLTRSKRITYDNLKLRDPGFAERIREWHELRTPDAKKGAPPMFTPFRLRDLEIPNRVVVSPMCMYSATEGVPNDFHYTHYTARALGGAGLVMTEMTCVAADARITPWCPGLWTTGHREAWARVVRFVHEWTPARIGLQLGHAGAKGSTRRMWEGIDQPLPEGNWPLIAPSETEYLAGVSQRARAMTRADMDRVRDEFVRAARLGAEAGFDWLELHAAHGYLLSAFLSPLTNRRTDAYGGDAEARARFPLEVFAAMRAAWPADRPMSVRLSAHDWAPGGNTPDDAVVLARLFKAAGADVIDVSAGQVVKAEQPVFGRMWQTPFADRVRQEAGVATIAVGAITDADQANGIIASGRADLVAVGRPHLANPGWLLTEAARFGYAGTAPLWPPQYRAAKQQLDRLMERERAAMGAAAGAPPKGELT